MTSILNKILYNYEVFDTTESISILEPYMVGGSGPIILQKSVIQESEIYAPIIIPKYPVIRTDKFFPKQDDTLFWCVFIAHYGLNEFYNVDRYKNRELEEKCKIMEFIKTLSKTDVLITKCSMQEMMGELMVAKNTTLFIVNALCMYYKMNFLFVYKDTYLEIDLKKLLVCTDCSEIPIGIIYKNEAGSTKYPKYAVDLYITPEKIQDIQNTKIRLEKYDRPLKGISTYKLTDLESMSSLLNLCENTTKQTKKDLYSNIWKNCLGFL
jgi:hypothetical protein